MIDFLMELGGINTHVLHRAILLVVVVWFVMGAAVYIDYQTGIRKSKVLKIPKDSHGIRRSFSKFGDYGKVTGMLMLVDILAVLFGIYSLPYGSGLAAVGVVYTEYKSVRENLAAIKSSAVKMTDILGLLADARDPKEIARLLLKYNTIKDGADKKQAKVETINNILDKLTDNDTTGI